MNKKIIIIGSPGSGKSCLARKLNELTGIPLHHMDNLYWRADRTHITRPELMEAVEAIMKTPEWIIDGNYIGTMGQRMQGAETIIYLDIPEEVCVEGIKSRVGMKRDDLPWVEETLDEEFLKFVIDFKTDTKTKIEDLLNLCESDGKEIFRLSSREEIDAFLKENYKNGACITELPRTVPEGKFSAGCMRKNNIRDKRTMNLVQ